MEEDGADEGKEEEEYKDVDGDEEEEEQLPESTDTKAQHAEVGESLRLHHL